MLAGNDTVVAVATTLLTPLPDTNVRFYRSDWSPARLALPEPAYNEWLTAKGRADMVRTRELLPFMLVEARIAPDASSVTLSNAAVRYVAAELRDEAAATVVPEMKFVLTGNKFVRQ